MNNTYWKKVLLVSLASASLGMTVGAEAPAEKKLLTSPSIRMALPLEEEKEHMLLSVDDGVLRPTYRDEQQTKKDVDKEKEIAAEKKKAKGDNGVSPEHPAVVKADRLHYNQTTGDVEAFGQVDIRHMMDTYQTEYAYGNTISQKYVIPGDVTWKSPTTRMQAGRADYDAESSIGHFEDLSGWDSNLYYFQGDSGVYDRNANHIIVQNGYFTTRHAVAKVPDYRIEAESIDIYPGDKYVAHNVKLMAKNTVLITLSTYKGSLKSERFSPWSLIPRPVFDSDNGFGLHNAIAIPLDGDMNLTFYLENSWYTKSGYKPDVGLRYDTSVGSVRFHYAEVESSTNDDGGIWVKKRPSLEFDSKHFYLFNSRFYVGVSGEWGYWEEGKVKGTHKGFDTYISGDPWKLGKFLKFSWRAGFEKDFYSYKNGYIRENTYYNVGLTGHYRSFDGWVRYTDHEFDGRTPYLYDSYSSNKPVDLGFRIQATHNDAFSLAWEIDTANGRLKHRYWTYYRDMHSFYAWIRYDDVDQEAKFMVMPKDFRF